MADILQLVADTVAGIPVVVMAVFLVCLVLILRVTKGLIGACVFIALSGVVLTAAWLYVWPVPSPLVMSNGWFKVIGVAATTLYVPLLIAGIPILLVARAQMRLLFKAAIGALGVIAALIAFPYVGILTSCALGDCL